MSRKKRIRYDVGDVFVVPLRDNSFGYGIVLKRPEMAFYECRSSQILSLTEVVACPILFRVLATDDAIEDGSWAIIGRASLSQQLASPQAYYVWSPLQEKPFLTYDGSERIWTTPEECKGLEKAMIWSPATIGPRLCDSLTGKQDRWVDAVAPSDANLG